MDKPQRAAETPFPVDVETGKAYFWCACGLSVLLELFVHRHPHFEADGIFGFYAILGFAACIIMILLAKALGVFLKVDESYYDDDESA